MANKIALPQIEEEGKQKFRIRLLNLLQSVVFMDATTITASGTTTVPLMPSVLLCDATLGNQTIAIPAATDFTAGTYFVKKTDNSVNTVTIDPIGATTIDGAATYVLRGQNDAVAIVSNGTAWYALAVDISLSALSQAVSVLSQSLSVTNAGLSNLTSAHNVLSNRVSANSASGSVTSAKLALETSNRISADNALSTAISVVSNALSNEISNRISADNALSVRINTVSDGVSVVSNALSNEISNRISADNALSQAISVISQQVSVLSQAVSVLTGAIGTTKFNTGSQVLSVATLSTVSGLIVSVSAGGLYQVYGEVLFITAAAGALIRLGVQFPAALGGVGAVGRFSYDFDAIGTQVVPFGGAASNSAIVNTSTAAASTYYRVIMDANMNFSATGTIQMRAGGGAGANAMVIQPGSFLQVIRIV